MNVSTEQLRDVLRTPYQERGRTVGVGLDCLGTVLEIASRMGLPAIDPWASIEEAWRTGKLDTASGFPDGWFRIAAEAAREDGDVLLFFEHHPWAAIVCAGHVWSADARLGRVWCRSLATWTKQPAEVWRHDAYRIRSQGLDW